MVSIHEGEETQDFSVLVGDNSHYCSLLKGMPQSSTPSLCRSCTSHTHYHSLYTLHTHTHTHTHTHHTHTHTESRSHDYTPRLFELTSTTGEFIATEVLYPARDSATVAFPFQQTDLYSAIQPGGESMAWWILWSRLHTNFLRFYY